ncbi:RDD family protein [Chitinimonas naiadis]
MTENQNPYAASKGIALDVSDNAGELAGRGARLGAAMIDGIILLVLIWTFVFVVLGISPTNTEGITFGITLIITAVNFGAFFLVNGYLLSQSGQTVGKKLVGLRIVRTDGSAPEFLHLVVRRYLPFYLVGLIPFVGSLAGLVNVLFVFRENRRCVHDLIADTKVVIA